MAKSFVALVHGDSSMNKSICNPLHLIFFSLFFFVVCLSFVLSCLLPILYLSLSLFLSRHVCLFIFLFLLSPVLNFSLSLVMSDFLSLSLFLSSHVCLFIFLLVHSILWMFVSPIPSLTHSLTQPPHRRSDNLKQISNFIHSRMVFVAAIHKWKCRWKKLT